MTETRTRQLFETGLKTQNPCLEDFVTPLPSDPSHSEVRSLFMQFKLVRCRGLGCISQSEATMKVSENPVRATHA